LAKVKGVHCGTYLPFVAANGDLLASYFILAMKFDGDGNLETTLMLPSSFSQTCNGMAPPVLFFNESGYLNSEIFPKIIEHFVDLWAA
jgi:hypothetical protein